MATMTPDEFTLQELFLDVGDGHQLYVQEWGNPKDKIPIIFLHGGPGSQCKDKHRQYFDPKIHRVIFFDQRGCGKSLPYGSLHKNTTPDLVEDINKIADHFSFNKFNLVGGSWGAALALFYSVTHPNRVESMVLDGILTGSKAELNWIDKGQLRTFIPDIWDTYTKTVPKKYQKDPSKYHFKRILSDDPEAVRQSGHAYESLEGAALSLDDRFTPEDLLKFDPNGIRIEVHYLANGFFMPDRHIFAHTNKLVMPIWLVQGRYDLVCPPVTAYELHRKLPNCHLIWTISGHKTEHESWNVLRTILLQLA